MISCDFKGDMIKEGNVDLEQARLNIDGVLKLTTYQLV